MKQNKKFDIEDLLSNLSVLNTSIGVKMIDDLSMTAPQKACAILNNVIDKATDEDIASITDYKQDLCMTLCRLCFYDGTFEQSVNLLLRFAQREKDGFGMANIGLQRLFFPLFGITEVNLEKRKRILAEIIDKNTNKELSVKLLECAITIQTAFFHDGTEKLADRDMKPYSPTNEELREYLSFALGCFQKMINEGQGALKEKLLDIINDHFIELCKYGYADVAIPTIESVCLAVENRWDKMLDNLLLFRDDIKQSISTDLLERYETLITKLNSKDFCFRFKRVEKELYRSSSFKLSPDEILKQQQKIYNDLAEEFIQSNLLSRRVLELLYEAEVISTSPFGEVVAKGLSESQRNEFIDQTIDIINERAKTQTDILVDFAVGTSEEDFDDIFNKMLNLKNKRPLFAAVARRSECFNNSYMDILLDLVRTGQATSDLFITYWSNFRFAYMKDEDLACWMAKVRELSNGPQTVLHILQSAINGDAYNKFPSLVDFALDTVGRIKIGFEHIMGFYQFWNVVRLLLSKGYNPELAKKVNYILLDFIKQQDGFIVNNYEVTQTYRLLLDKYFNEIWSDLSSALLSDGDQGWFYHRLKEIMGSMIGNVHNDVGLLFENDNTETLIEWCRQNPTIAPVRLMEMAPVFEDDHFSNIVYMLIDGFGQNKNVLNALSSNLCSFGWIGSVIPLYNKEIKALETLKEHQFKEVRDWSAELIAYLENEIKKEVNAEW